MLQETDDYRKLFIQGLPLLDTRAPLEFEKGAFPNSVNIPLMTDLEREQVGTCYKQVGKQAAIELGESLVSGSIKQRRIDLWCEFARSNPNGYLYCFRGGLRSQITQRWMQQAGVDYPRIIGGYKAMRRYLIDSLAKSIESSCFYLIAGKTGTGKTRAIEKINRAIDLEALAEHRGSSFGRLPTAQPKQIGFENALSIELLKTLNCGDTPIFLEDESKMIGCICLPAALCTKMQQAPLLIVEESLHSRVQIICQDYIDDLGQRFQKISPDQGKSLHKNHMLDALYRIRKRLGSELHHRLTLLMRAAFDSKSDSTSETAHALHRQWIELLLTQYYDPMYEYQINRRGGSVLARGNREEIIEMANGITA